MEILVKKLNQTLRGWGNYHRHVVSSEAFSLIDTYVYERLWRMIRRRHRKKSKKWLTDTYWTHSKRRWMFTVKGKNKKGPCIYQVVR
ncbi:MAG: group II intron reverse transcriptase/maturase, partial [Desulfobacteraceae bacterium]|nr:group II intron reverse transcriptase/maturase [Desulfobacteraceae bacterium]